MLYVDNNIIFITWYLLLHKISRRNIYGCICVMEDMKGGLIIETVIRYLTALKSTNKAQRKKNELQTMK